MRRLDDLHFQYAFAGIQMLRDFLNCAGTLIGRRHARRDGVHANVPRARLQGAPTKKAVLGENGGGGSARYAPGRQSAASTIR